MPCAFFHTRKMRTLYLCFILLHLSLAGAGAQYHKRLIVTGGSVVYIPEGHSRECSLTFGEVRTLAERLRKELGEENVFLIDIPVNKQPLKSRLYSALGDTTAEKRYKAAAGYASDELRDSILTLFGLTAEKITEALGPDVYLQSDRYEVQGLTETKHEYTLIPDRYDYLTRDHQRSFPDQYVNDRTEVEEFLRHRPLMLDTTIHTQDNYFGPSAFTALFHRFQLDASGADISFFAPPKQYAELQQGERSLMDVLKLFSYDNQLVTVRISGKQLKTFMEEVFGMRYFSLKGTDSDLVRLKVPYYLHDDVSGIRFRVDLTKPSGKRLTLYEMADGSRFEPDKTYTVVLNSFRARYFTEKGIPVRCVRDDYRLALAEWLLLNPELAPRADDNWSLAPERWVKTISKREQKTNFNR